MSLPQQLQNDIAAANQIARDAGLANAPLAEAPVIASTEPINAPVNPAPAQQPAPPPQQPASNDDDASWRKKYEVLQGKYNAEVPRTIKELNEAREQLSQLQETVQELSAVPRQNYEGAYDPNDPDLAIAPEVREEYGPEFFDVVARTARQVMAPMVAQMTTAMEELRRGLVGTSQQVVATQHMTFLEQLDNAKENWRTLNTDEGFKSWLDIVDPMSGIARKHLLTDAYKAKDVQRTLAFLNAYEQESGIAPPAARKPATPQQRVPETSLEAMAAPGRGRPAQPAQPAFDPNNDPWTHAEINAFYADVKAGRFVGKEAEKDAFERRIARAAALGKVT